MTGLNNRRHFLVLAEIEWARFKRYGRPLGVLMIDVDRFKSVNDTFGHAAGDLVIKAVAEVLQKHKRSSDISGRFGGEEFVAAASRSASRQRARGRRTIPEAGRRARTSTLAGSISHHGQHWHQASRAQTWPASSKCSKRPISRFTKPSVPAVIASARFDPDRIKPAWSRVNGYAPWNCSFASRA